METKPAAADHKARSIQISLCTHHTLQCTAKRANFFSNATNVHLWDISEQSVWERFCLGNAIWSPHLLAFTFLFVWLPDAWLQQQPWQRGSWQAEKARGIAPLCCRPPPPSSTPSPLPGPSTSKTAGCCQAQRPPSSAHGPSAPLVTARMSTDN